MVTGVQQHVAEHVANVARRTQDPHVITVGKHRSLSTEVSVDGLGNPDAQTLHATTERGVVVRFGDDVHMVGLKAEVDQAQTEHAALRERAKDRFAKAPMP